jgi:multiple sugar transport system permease protein
MPMLYWLATVVIGYAALALWVANLTRALRLGQRLLAAVLTATPVVLLIAAPWMGAMRRPLIFVLCLLAITMASTRLLAPGQPAISAKDSRPALLHLILITGSAIFLVPFIWMVVTSLKEDSQLAKLPPEWIPTQQVRVLYNGHTRGLVRLFTAELSLPFPWRGEGLGERGRLPHVTGIAMHMNDDGTCQVLAPVTVDSAGVVRPSAQARILTLTRDEYAEVRHDVPVWSNYPAALKYLPKNSQLGLVNLKNTLIISLLCVVGTVLSSSLVAYGFARLRWPGRDVLFGLLLATMMLPDAVTMMPRFLIFRQLHWVDTLLPLWAPSFFGSAFNVFLLRQFFLGIPKELEEAARIDGCSYLRTYWSIMLPMVRPAVAAIAIMTFLGSWKDFLGPLIYISSPEKMPLSYVLQLYNSAHTGEPNLLMAATTLVMLPVVLLFFFTQRYFIEGVTLTGLGGR